VLKQYFIIGESDLVTIGEFDQPWKKPIFNTDVFDEGKEFHKSACNGFLDQVGD